jgi:hypothetical protein
MGDDRLLHGLGEVLPQVEPVSYLDRGRGSLPSSVGITSATVAADHLDPRMLAQPLGQAGAVATLEHLDQPMPLQIDQDGPITAAATERKVVHAEHRHRADRRVGQAPDHT